MRYRWEIPDLDWVLAIPWPAVAAIALGVPAIATAVGWGCQPTAPASEPSDGEVRWPG